MPKKPIPFYLTGILRTLGLAGAILAPTCSFAEDLTHNEWNCSSDPNGSWVCTEQTVAGRGYKRPQRPEAEPAPEDEGPRVRLARNLDWVYEEDMTVEERKLLSPGCCGAYIEPKREYPDADLNPDEATLRVASASTEVEQETNIAHLEGNVQLTQGYRQVRSDRASVDQERRTIELEGNVQFREPNALAIGDSAEVNLDNNAAVIKNVSFVDHDAGIRGTAETLVRETEGILFIDNATYTTCEPASNAWQLAMGSATLNAKTGIMTARHTRLEIEGVPVLYIPWIRFPFDDRRASGLLFPNLSVSDENGLDYAQPIYLNLAPNYDATITPRFVQERGEMLELEGRYLSARTYTVASGGFLSDDDGGDDDDETIKAYQGEDRWVGSLQHEGGLGRRWSTNIDYTKVSDSEYFRDLGNASLEINSQTHLEQSAAAGYRLRHWDLSLQGKRYQTIIDNAPQQYELLPRATARGRYRLGEFTFDLKNQFTSYDHKDDDLNVLADPGISPLRKDSMGTFITGDRLRLDYAASWDKQWVWGYFRPTAMVKYLAYDLDNPLDGKTDDSPSVTVPVGIIDAGLFAERNTSWLKGYLQTFEPRLYYLHSEYEDQSDLPNFDTANLTFSYNQLFRDDRFSGGDRIGDTEQLSIGLTSRLVSKSTGEEFVRASIGQVFYFDDRFVSLNPNLTETDIKNPDGVYVTVVPAQLVNYYDLEEQVRDESAYAAELALRLGKNFRLQLDALYDEEESEVDKGNVSLRYRDQQQRIFNIGYRYTRRIPRFVEANEIDADIDQGDVSTILPLAENWRFVGRWNYDFTNSRELETFAGIEYDSCCWRVSLLARKWLDRDDRLGTDYAGIPEDDLEEDEGIFLQIQLKGLGGTGTKVDGILEDGIYGFVRQQ